jgi:membrane fusion protein, heavy metal efflux system
MTIVSTRCRVVGAVLTLALASRCSPAPTEEPVRPVTPSDAVSLSKASEEVADITVEVATAASVGSTVDAMGTIALDDTKTARIGSLVEGLVVSTSVNVGDRVRRGAMLAGLHSHEVHDNWSDYRKALADRRRAQQALAFAEDAVGRAERLLADKAAPAVEVERARTERASAVEQVAMAEAEVRRARESLEHLGLPIDPTTDTRAAEIIPVRTPLGGVVLEKLVTTGTAVTPGAPLFVVSDTSSLWVRVEVDESALVRVKVGAAVELTVSAYPGDPFQATVISIGDTINPETRRVVVRGQLRNADGRLKPGMFARVQLEGAAAAPLVLLPVDAIQDLGERRVVFVPGGNGRYVARDVETGAERGGRIEIRSGLTAGERVVVRGAFLLKSQLLASPEGES